MSDSLGIAADPPKALPTIDYSTDHVDMEALFQPENALRLQLIADAIVFRRERKPFGSRFFGALVNIAVLSLMFRSRMIVPALAMVVLSEYLLLKTQRSAIFPRFLVAQPAIWVAAMAVPWIDSAGTFADPLVLAYAVMFGTIGCLGTLYLWIAKRPRWEELSVVRVQPGLDKVFDNVELDLRSRRFDEAAHVYVGPLNFLLRIGRVGGLLVSVGGKKGIINFASPENVSIATEPRQPGLNRDRLWLLWNDERFRIRADATAIGVFLRLKSDTLSPPPAV